MQSTGKWFRESLLTVLLILLWESTEGESFFAVNSATKPKMDDIFDKINKQMRVPDIQKELIDNEITTEQHYTDVKANDTVYDYLKYGNVNLKCDEQSEPALIRSSRKPRKGRRKSFTVPRDLYERNENCYDNNKKFRNSSSSFQRSTSRNIYSRKEDNSYRTGSKGRNGMDGGEPPEDVDDYEDDNYEDDYSFQEENTDESRNSARFTKRQPRATGRSIGSRRRPTRSSRRRGKGSNARKMSGYSTSSKENSYLDNDDENEDVLDDKTTNCPAHAVTADLSICLTLGNVSSLLRPGVKNKGVRNLSKLQFYCMPKLKFFVGKPRDNSNVVSVARKKAIGKRVKFTKKLDWDETASPRTRKSVSGNDNFYFLRSKCRSKNNRKLFNNLSERIPDKATSLDYIENFFKHVRKFTNQTDQPSNEINNGESEINELNYKRFLSPHIMESNNYEQEDGGDYETGMTEVYDEPNTSLYDFAGKGKLLEEDLLALKQTSGRGEARTCLQPDDLDSLGTRIFQAARSLRNNLTAKEEGLNRVSEEEQLLQTGIKNLGSIIRECETLKVGLSGVRKRAIAKLRKLMSISQLQNQMHSKVVHHIKEILQNTEGEIETLNRKTKNN